MADRLGVLEQLRDPPGFWRRDPVDAPSPILPATIERRAHPLLAVLLSASLVMPLVLLGSLMLVPVGPGEPSLLNKLVAEQPMVPIAIGVALLVETIVLSWLLRPALRRRSYTVSRVMVSCESRSPFGNEEWQESLGAYDGVRLTRVRQKGGALHVVRLVHPQPDRCVPLYVTGDLTAAQRQQAAWAAALHLTAPHQQEFQL